MGRIYNFIYTGALYTIIVLITVYFTKRANRAKLYNQFLVYSFVALIIPSIFAGLRSLDVGTDVMVYAYPQFKMAAYYASFTDYYSASGMEFGYAVIVYISNHFFHSIQLLLMLTAFLQLLPVYFGAAKLKKIIPMEKVVLVYMLLFYVIGFNIMRQCIAAGWIFLALVLISKENHLKAAASCIVALLFHGTAIFGILTLGMFVIFKVVKKRRRMLFWTVLLFVVMVSLARYWTEIIYLMGTWKLLPFEKVVGYSKMFSGGKSFYTDIVLSQYVEAFFKVALLVVCYSKKDRVEENLYMPAFGTYLMGVLLYMYFLLAFHTSFGYRLSLFAEYSLLLLIPIVGRTRIKQVTKRNSITVGAKSFIVWGTAIMNFIILFVLFGIHGTYPFRFVFE